MEDMEGIKEMDRLFRESDFSVGSDLNGELFARLMRKLPKDSEKPSEKPDEYELDESDLDEVTAAGRLQPPISRPRIMKDGDNYGR